MNVSLVFSDFFFLSVSFRSDWNDAYVVVLSNYVKYNLNLNEVCVRFVFLIGLW